MIYLMGYLLSAMHSTAISTYSYLFKLYIFMWLLQFLYKYQLPRISPKKLIVTLRYLIEYKPNKIYTF
jgi:hypothetical protein